uniref:Protein aurora borealis n=1 Tax=Sphenodon punctatus TaxID=8508 RepID=A0A8D0H4F0_SPHPU
MTPPSTRSPYVGGCSPIKNCSPMRFGACRGTTQYRTSLIRIPFTLENHKEEQEDKENAPPIEVTSMDPRVNLQQLDGDAFVHGTRLVVARVSLSPDHSESCDQGLVLFQDLDGLKENNTIDMVDPDEVLDVNNSVKESVNNSSMPMTSFMTGITFSIESSRMCMSPLAESSAIPCDSSSIQVDSGYNTQTCGSSLMDVIGVETSCKENHSHTYKAQNKSQVPKTKKDNQLLRAKSPEMQPYFHEVKTSDLLLNENTLKPKNGYQDLHKHGRTNSPRTLDGKSAPNLMQPPIEMPLLK